MAAVEMPGGLYRNVEPWQLIVAGDTNFYGITDGTYFGEYHALPMFRHMSQAAPNEKTSGKTDAASRGDGCAQFVFGDGHVEGYEPDDYLQAVREGTVHIGRLGFDD